MHERRLTTRLSKHWDSLRKELPVPDMARLDMQAITDVAPNLLTLKVVRDSSVISYQYIYMGEAIVKTYGADLTHQIVNIHMHDFPGVRILRRMEELTTYPHVISDDGQFISKSHNIVRYRACLLPFGTEQNSLTHIVAGLSWKEY